MDNTEIQKLQNTVKEAQETAHKALQLVEAITRRHPEQDAKLAVLLGRIVRLEKILKVEIANTEKEDKTKRTFLDRALGR